VSEEQANQQAENAETEETQNSENTENKGILADLVAKRQEAADLKAKLDAMEREKAEAEKAALEKKEEYKTLYEKEKAEREADLETYKPRAEAFDAYEQGRKESLLEALGDNADDFKDLPLAQLEKVAAKLTTEKKNLNDAGRAGRTITGGTYEDMPYSELAIAISKGDPKARAELKRRNG